MTPKFIFRAFLLSLLATLLLTACGAGDNLGEAIAEQAVDQALGEGTLATSEAFVAAVATDSAEIDTTTSDTSKAASGTEPQAAATPLPQNDANSGGDAGAADNPLELVAGMGYSGMLTNASNGGDVSDVYRIATAPYEIVRVTASVPATQTEPVNLTFANGDGYETASQVMPGTSAELLLASANPQVNLLTITYGGLSDSAEYQLDVVVEPENDANSGSDAPNTAAQALSVAVATPHRGASVGNETGSNDPDCYQVELPAEGSSLRATVTSLANQPYPSSIWAILYNTDGGLITSDTAELGQTITLSYGEASYETAAAGSYAVCVQSYFIYPYGLYELTLTVDGAEAASDNCLPGNWAWPSDHIASFLGEKMGMDVTVTGDLLFSYGEIDPATGTGSLAAQSRGLMASVMDTNVALSADAVGSYELVSPNAYTAADAGVITIASDATGAQTIPLPLGGEEPVTFSCEGDQLNLNTSSQAFTLIKE